MKNTVRNPKIEPSPEWYMPTVEEAIDQWRTARRRFLSRAGSSVLDDFHEANTLLFVSFLGDDAEQSWAVTAFQEFRRTLVASEPDIRSGESGI